MNKETKELGIIEDRFLSIKAYWNDINEKQSSLSDYQILREVDFLDYKITNFRNFLYSVIDTSKSDEFLSRCEEYFETLEIIDRVFEGHFLGKNS